MNKNELKPFNDFYYLDCGFNLIFSFLKYRDKNIVDFILDNKYKFDVNDFGFKIDIELNNKFNNFSLVKMETVNKNLVDEYLLNKNNAILFLNDTDHFMIIKSEDGGYKTIRQKHKNTLSYEQKHFRFEEIDKNIKQSENSFFKLEIFEDIEFKKIDNFTRLISLIFNECIFVESIINKIKVDNNYFEDMDKDFIVSNFNKITNYCKFIEYALKGENKSNWVQTRERVNKLWNSFKINVVKTKIIDNGAISTKKVITILEKLLLALKEEP